MSDFNRIRQNVELMVKKGAPVEHINGYLSSEGLTPETFKRAILSSPTQQEYNPTDGMSFGDKVAAGFGKALYDVGRGVGNIVTDIAPSASKLGFATRSDTEESNKRDAALMQTGGGIAGNILGNVAAFAPTAFIPGANTITGGAALGGLTGLLQPVGSNDSRSANVAGGAALGAVMPAALKGAKIAKAAFFDPFSNKGQSNIIGSTLNTVAGKDAEIAAKNMANASTPFIGPSMEATPIRKTMGEIVPGSIPTAAEVANNAGIAALQRAASQTDPIVMNEYANIAKNQNAARVAALSDIAGDDGKRAFFAADRDSVANSLYKNAYDNYDPGQLSPYIKGQITQLLKRPSINDGSKIAQKLAMERGEKPSPQGSLRALHDVKIALDDKISKAIRDGAGGEANALMATKEKLLDTMERMSPEYGDARVTYAAMSKPINQMDTAQAIANKAINPLTGKLQPQSYAKALNDSTAAGATGFQKATLENTFDSHSLNNLNAIKDDLARSVFAQNEGRGVGSDTVQKLALSNIMSQTGLPSWITSLAPSQIAGRLASQASNVLYSNANKELSTKLAEALMNPKTAAELMLSSNQKSSEMANLLRKASQGLMLSAPASINSLEQQ